MSSKNVGYYDLITKMSVKLICGIGHNYKHSKLFGKGSLSSKTQCHLVRSMCLNGVSTNHNNNIPCESCE